MAAAHLAFDRLDRSMGVGALHPFVLDPAVVAKLGSIHDPVRGRIYGGEPEQPVTGPVAPVPETIPQG